MPSEPSKVKLIIVVTRPLNCDIPFKCAVSLPNRSSRGAVRRYNDFPPSSIIPSLTSINEQSLQRLLVRGLLLKKSAATYSPAGVQYHRRAWAYLLCSEWEEVEPQGYNHRNSGHIRQLILDSFLLSLKASRLRRSY